MPWLNSPGSEGAAFWLSRAEEARAMAETMHYAGSRLALLRIAQIYAELAARAEERRDERQH